MTRDFYEIKKQKKRQRTLKKLIAVLIISLLGILLFNTRDKWFSKLEGIGSKYNDLIKNGEDGSSDSFPLSISGGIDYQTGALDDYFILVGDTNTKLYSTDGKLSSTEQHAYGNPILKISPKRALIYDLGGNKFNISSKYKTIYEKTLDDNIIFARISSDGFTAVVTTSKRYVCFLTVFNENGEVIYTRGSVDRITDICFKSGSTGCYSVTVSASNGQLTSTVHSFDFDKDNEQWVSDALDTLCVSAYNNENGIVFFGDTKCAFIDKNGKVTESYTYDSTLSDYACVNNKAAILLKDEARRKNKLVILDSSGKSPVELSFGNDLKCIYSDNYYIYLMTDNKVSACSTDGKEVHSVSVSDSYDDFLKIGDYVFLLGYDRIDRIDFLIT